MMSSHRSKRRSGDSGTFVSQPEIFSNAVGSSSLTKVCNCTKAALSQSAEPTSFIDEVVCAAFTPGFPMSDDEAVDKVLADLRPNEMDLTEPGFAAPDPGAEFGIVDAARVLADFRICETPLLPPCTASPDVGPRFSSPDGDSIPASVLAWTIEA